MKIVPGHARPMARALTAVIAVSALLAAPAASAGPAQSIDHRTLALERRIIAFDGRTSHSDGQETVVTLDADVLFEFDSDRLTDQARATLAALVTDIVDSEATGTVTVTGHTDSTGTHTYNLDLSRRRADAVAAELGAASELTIATRARGELDPVATNDTADGRRRNRRVEIRYTATRWG